ncbi:MAG: membrane protein insertion efficiency factor YidD [Ruminococcus sp.]|nr:membrane protein insertion efficiency factor YidD [Ruminococcus sp.]
MKKFFIKAIRFYQKNISPNTKPKCKYYPTCSQYAVEAIEIHGAFKGFFLSLWRFLRCNPFSRGGFDPVPEKKEKKRRGNS